MEEPKEAPRAEAAAARYPLAYDANGEPLAVPAEAVAWRVRRGGGRRGRPKNVFTAAGRPLEVPIAATIEELVNEGCVPDSYLLYAIDAAGRALPGVVAVTEVQGDEDEEASDHGTSAAAENEVTALGHALTTIRIQAESMARSIDSLSRGYHPVQAAQPTALEQPIAPSAPTSPGSQMEQIATYAKLFMDLMRSGGLGGPLTPAPASTP